jgi:hypothetical protein
MSSKYVRLSRTEIVPGRPFTNPAGSREDIGTLQDMAEKLRQLLGRPETIPAQPRPFVLYLSEAGGRRHRIALSKPEALLTGNDLTVVGFCGRKWPGADRAPLDAVDAELITEFSQHPHLLSYSSLELGNGNWCNLVLFSHPRGLLHWATSARHAYAVRELSPAYYMVIRLHNAILPGGLMSGKPLILLRTKYYDYQDKPPWLAVRELQKR